MEFHSLIMSCVKNILTRSHDQIANLRNAVFNPNLQFSIGKPFFENYNIHLLPTTRIAFSYLIEKNPSSVHLDTANIVINPMKQLHFVKSHNTVDTFESQW